MIPAETAAEQASEREALLLAALDCYLSVIQQIADCLADLGPDIAAPHQEQLLRLRQRLAFQPTVSTLEEARETLGQELTAFSQRARDYRESKAEDLQQLLLVLAQAGDALSLRRDGYSDQLRHLSREVENSNNPEDPERGRQRLLAQLEALRGFVESVYQENNNSLLRMQERMEEFRKRLNAAETMATLDPLTGLANRRELDRQLSTRMAAEKQFCLLLFDVDDFKAINDTHGHLCGDEILRQIAGRLASQIRVRDFVCRWGGDEFLVILECSIANARHRCQQIARWLSGPYRIAADGRELTVDIGLSVGVAEREPGDSLDQLFQRADALMYKRKAEGKATAPSEAISSASGIA
jgi:diguanylate cyclase